MLIALRIIQFLLILGVVIVIWSQVISPAIKGTKLFPMYSSRRNKAKDTIRNSNDELEIQSLETKAAQAKERVTVAQPKQ